MENIQKTTSIQLVSISVHSILYQDEYGLSTPEAECYDALQEATEN